ncbi:hypothetical protein GRF29_164g1230306 [Pseudopithomyces chartarum]|uniref:Uncharacterized protein n=1 Tax=Pseudopithomyces chartarum TaxID=1892770 RepID=A0AAN6RCX8_9PLEO|nr:hypothetical protein GRF29_164g1230306 [Pseudopithomyces chartarum]
MRSHTIAGYHSHSTASIEASRHTTRHESRYRDEDVYPIALADLNDKEATTEESNEESNTDEYYHKRVAAVVEPNTDDQDENRRHGCYIRSACLGTFGAEQNHKIHAETPGTSSRETSLLSDPCKASVPPDTSIKPDIKTYPQPYPLLQKTIRDVPRTLSSSPVPETQRMTHLHLTAGRT